MTDKQEKTLPVDVESPETEEEVPFEGGRKVSPGYGKKTREIGEKDNRAFWLTCVCIAILAVISGVDALMERDIMEDSQTVKSLFEIVKYVITTSLGFFFATTVAKKE